MDINQLGENSQYIQKQFSVSYVTDSQYAMGGGEISTRNFGAMGQMVKKAAMAKREEMAKTKPSKRTKADNERLQRLAILTDYDPGADTNERTRRLRNYDFDKRSKGWKDVVWNPEDKDSIYNAAEDVAENMAQARKWKKSLFFKKRGEQYEKKGLNAYWRWRNGVPKYGDSWKEEEPTPTPPPYTGPMPPPYKPKPIPTPPPWKPYVAPGGKNLKIKVPKS